MKLAPWCRHLFRPFRYKCAWGGRGSGKSWSFAAALLLLGTQKKSRIVGAREYQSSIKESSYQLMCDSIQRLNLESFYKPTANTIIGANGTKIFFTGLERMADSLKSLEAATEVWCEEGQRLSKKSWEILRPTVRAPGSEIWVTMNPDEASDVLYQFFIQNKPPNSFVKKVNYNLNPWLPPELEAERVYTKRTDPDIYPNIWLGVPTDGINVKRVLPYTMVEECVEAYEKYIKDVLELKFGMQRHAGLDVADEGADKNSFTARRGPIVQLVEEWSSQFLSDTADRADSLAKQNGIVKLFYDSQGVGAGIRSHLNQMKDRKYMAKPILFGSKVEGEKTDYAYQISNKEFFSRRNSQLGWAVRLRALSTGRLLSGEDIDLSRCLFINPRINDLEGYLLQLAQPQWKDGKDGRIEIIKADKNEKSPDRYDSTVLSYGQDSEYGLTMR